MAAGLHEGKYETGADPGGGALVAEAPPSYLGFT